MIKTSSLQIRFFLLIEQFLVEGRFPMDLVEVSTVAPCDHRHIANQFRLTCFMLLALKRLDLLRLFAFKVKTTKHAWLLLPLSFTSLSTSCFELEMINICIARFGEMLSLLWLWSYSPYMQLNSSIITTFCIFNPQEKVMLQLSSLELEHSDDGGFFLFLQDTLKTGAQNLYFFSQSSNWNLNDYSFTLNARFLAVSTHFCRCRKICWKLKWSWQLISPCSQIQFLCIQPLLLLWMMARSKQSDMSSTSPTD